MHTRSSAVRVIRTAIAVAALAGLGGCISISQRAWANGEAMTESHAYGEVAAGSMSFRAHRELQASLSPFRIGYADRAYAPLPKFGTWW